MTNNNNRSNNLIHAVGYIQSIYNRSDSIERQEESIRQYCKAHKFGSLTLFKDIGESATLPLSQREAWKNLIEAVNDGNVDLLLVENMSHIAQNPLVLNPILRKLDKLGVSIKITTTPIEDNTSTIAPVETSTLNTSGDSLLNPTTEEYFSDNILRKLYEMKRLKKKA